MRGRLGPVERMSGRVLCMRRRRDRLFGRRGLSHRRRYRAARQDLQTFEDQIFSCSALGFAPEFQLAPEEFAALGKIREVDARIGNSWSKYAVHIIEPTLNLVGDNGEIRQCTRAVSGDECRVTVGWDSGLETRFTTTGSSPTPPQLNIVGERRSRQLVFTDAFGAFKAALARFVLVARGESRTIPRRFLMHVMQIVETGVGRE